MKVLNDTLNNLLNNKKRLEKLVIEVRNYRGENSSDDSKLDESHDDKVVVKNN